MGGRRSSGHSVEGRSTLGCSTLDWEGIHTILEITVASKAGVGQGLRRKEEKAKASEGRQLEAVPSTLELIFCPTGGEGRDGGVVETPRGATWALIPPLISF